MVWLLFLAYLASFARASSVQSGPPTVTIKNGTVIGVTSSSIDSFSGIPFAQPPVGNLRLRPPQTISVKFPRGTFQATSAAVACPQFSTQNDAPPPPLPSGVPNIPLSSSTTNESEDCLTITVQRPSGIKANAKLPVVFWIYGGGFAAGATSMYDGSHIVNASMNLGQPIIYVAVNYRLNGFGFLAGKALADEHSTNLGLRDQRLGMQWVQENILAFGGDPDRVTLWGESAGALSICDHTVINQGDNSYKGRALFRGAIMNSGTILPATDVTSGKAQKIYDTVVANSPCVNSVDSLQCLRSLDYETFKSAVDSVPSLFSYRSVDLSYLPRPDSGDNFFPVSPEVNLATGKFVKMPIIVGDQEDEGTLFSLFQSNITTNDQLVQYLASFFPTDPQAITHQRSLASFYPDEPLLGQPYGSPFGTGPVNNAYAQYKRLAAILGDFYFTLMRRAYLSIITQQNVRAYSYLATFLYGTPFFGTFHGSDVLYNFNMPTNSSAVTQAFETYYVNFINHLSPNVPAGNLQAPLIQWPQWTLRQPSMLNITTLMPVLLQDTFRGDAGQYIREHIPYFRF